MRLVILLAVVVVSALGAPQAKSSPNEVGTRTREGFLNGGKWRCTWHLSGFSCRDGDFHCPCANGHQGSNKIGCCYKFPRCGEICNKNTNCDRYKNCHSCRNNVGEHDKVNVCNTCKPGWALGAGNCHQDIDECLSQNGKCDHKCHNTPGSYHCTCNDGYKLGEDKHSCERLSCGDPGPLANGAVQATDNWMHDSFAKYSCQGKGVLVGYAQRKCLGQGSSVSWQGSAPVCRDKCEIPGEIRRGCGPLGITEEGCQQYGCCYKTDPNPAVPKCYHTPDPAFIKFGGIKPKPNHGNGFYSQPESTVEGCNFDCQFANNLQCKSFGMRKTGESTPANIIHHNCHLQTKSVSQFNTSNELEADPNYDLYEITRDDFVTQSQKSNTVEHMFEGCFKEDTNKLDFEDHIWTSTNRVTIQHCIKDCRDHGYSYAALRGGNMCSCTNNKHRFHGTSTECNIKCSQNEEQICGGTSSNSVYAVDVNRNFIGCFSDIGNDRDLSNKRWDVDAGKSAFDCVQKCKYDGFLFAGVQNGGACYCGNSYGRHGAASGEDKCSSKCKGWHLENCGARLQNAIYNTEKPFEYKSPAISKEATRIFIEDATGIPTKIFSDFPLLKTVVSKRLIIDAGEAPAIPLTDPECAEDCYKPCGNIYQPEGLIETGEHVTVRYLFLDLATLPTIVREMNGKSSAKSVKVYAQTVLINQDVEVDFALMIKARQILLDRSKAQKITVRTASEPFKFDLSKAVHDGAPTDTFFYKQSYMCARILIETKEKKHKNIAWKIIQGIVDDSPAAISKEDKKYIEAVRGFRTEMRGIQREDVHFVPFYTKTYMAEILKNYYEKITIYKADFDRLSTTEGAAFVSAVEGMLRINVNTDIAEARSSFEASINALTRSNLTFVRITQHYGYARTRLETARVDFENGIKEQQGWAIAGAVLGFVKGIVGVVFGAVSIKVDPIGGLDQVISNVQEMIETMKNLAASMAQINAFMETIDIAMRELEDLEGEYDFSRYMHSIEMTAQLRVNIIKWKNLRNSANTLLTSPSIVNVRGSANYRRRFLDLSNWGEALTKTAVERAEMVRQALRKRMLLESKQEQAKRYEKYVEDLKKGILSNIAVRAFMAQQTYDIRLDLNEALITFCRAFFYENLGNCRAHYRPQFGGSLSDLLLRINAARRDALFLPDAPSTVRREIVIKDTDNDPDCTDSEACPLNYLKKNRQIIWTLPTNHQAISDLFKYRVAEIRLNFVGAKKTGQNSKLKVQIESSGDFKGRSKDASYNFITRALRLTYEYDLDTSEISIHADVYRPFRNIVSHITPYTTWILRISDDRSRDIDLSEVTELRMRLDGSAVDGENKKFMQSQN
ncbi:DgyrCDS13040 [Dimorphilus gyrociliatus]|uniref:DgyrCDS13040 n=1 Tax=Dimorphilus gyrociliatus TaxID=2664684 RepID=A0A7I8W9J1_9ANNE|nr:DgyrCDS13040 [Dimorphilus gyrociliatus]